jgi:hypothetical protein
MLPHPVRADRDYTSVRAERDHIANAESLSIRADWIRHGAHAITSPHAACASHASEPKGW